MKTLDVVGFGALNVDKLFKVNRLSGAEEESFIETHEEQCGGSAANTSVGLSRLGCSVGFVGKIGGDREGRMLIEDFQKEGVDTDGVVLAKYGESGVVMGFVDSQGQRALYIHSGVNDSIASEEVKQQYISQAKFLHLSSFVGDKSFQTQRQIMEALPETVKVSFDPGILYARRGYAALAPIVEKSFVFLPNSKELELLTGEKDPKKGAEAVISKGAGIVAVKLGEKGCLITDGNEQFTLAAVKVGVVDTTGAGDAFDAGFLYGLLNGKPLLECGKIANFVASRAVRKMGARAGLPYKKDLELLDKVVK